MTSRKAVVTWAVLIPIILGVSTLAYASMTATGSNPSDNNNNFFGNPRCTTTVTGENSGNNAIQTAINSAHSGDVICVASGSYPEQLLIITSLTLQGLGTQHNPTIISPTSVAANAVSPDSGASEAAIIAVSGAMHVTISNLVVDGSAVALSSILSCGLRFFGVLYLNAGGTLDSNTVQNVTCGAGLYGDQNGDAVLVQTGAYNGVSNVQGTDLSTVTISNNNVLNYQKNGITCNDSGSTCNISGNTVSPLAAAQAIIASNGIQVGFGAVGTVSDNTVSGNECGNSNCGPNIINLYQSAGILTDGSGKGTVVSGNTISGNDVGILSYGDTATSTNNQVQDNRFEGLLLADGSYTATNNDISCGQGHHDTATCQIGIAVVSDGFVATATTANLGNNGCANFNGNFNGNFGNNSCGNSFGGNFATAQVQVTAYNGPGSGSGSCDGACGGSNAAPATVSIGGFTETVTSGVLTPSDVATFVNLTNLPSD